MRGELPPQWVPAFDIIMPLKPKVRTVGGDWLSWNLARVDAMRAFEHEHKDILHWSIGDSEVCARAGRCACAIDDMLNGHPLPMSRQDKLDTVLDYCERLDVDRPNAKTPQGVIARGRRLRLCSPNRIEDAQHLILPNLGHVHVAQHRLSVVLEGVLPLLPVLWVQPLTFLRGDEPFARHLERQRPRLGSCSSLF